MSEKKIVIYYIIYTYLKSMTIYNMYNRPDMG